MIIKRRQVYTVDWVKHTTHTDFAVSGFPQALKAAKQHFPTRQVRSVTRGWRDEFIYVVMED